MGDHDAVAIDDAPSKPIGQSDGHEDEETDRLGLESEPSTEVPEAVRTTRSVQRHQ